MKQPLSSPLNNYVIYDGEGNSLFIHQITVSLKQVVFCGKTQTSNLSDIGKLPVTKITFFAEMVGKRGRGGGGWAGEVRDGTSSRNPDQMHTR